MGLPGSLPADGDVVAGDEHSIHLHILDVTEGESSVFSFFFFSNLYSLHR